MADGATQRASNRRVIIGGWHQIEGRAKGNYCTVDKPDRVRVDVGVDGEGVFIENDDQSGTVTIACMPSSKSNDVLSAYEKAGAPFPITVIEVDGSTSFSSARARVTRQAPVTWSDGSEVRQWTIVSTRLLGGVGGMDATAVATEVP